MLCATRPTAVNLSWAVERAGGGSGPDGGESLLGLARALHREQEEADRRLSAFGAERFEPGDRALTSLQRSPPPRATARPAVLRRLSGAAGAGVGGRDRPLLQGSLLTAWELRRAGTPPGGGRLGRRLAHLPWRGRSDRGRRRPHRRQRRRGQQDRHLPAGRWPPVTACRSTWRLRSTVDPDTPNGAAIPIEERDPAEVTVHGLAFNPARHHPGRARHGHLHRGRRARAPVPSRSGVSLRADRRGRAGDAAAWARGRHLRQRERRGRAHSHHAQRHALPGDRRGGPGHAVGRRRGGRGAARAVERAACTWPYTTRGRKWPRSCTRTACTPPRGATRRAASTPGPRRSSWPPAAVRPRPTPRPARTRLPLHAVEALKDRRAALLAEHGVLAVGATPGAALVTGQVVERQAQIASCCAAPP